MSPSKSPQQAAVMWVVGAACAVFVGGFAAMAFLAMQEIPIPDQLDRLVNLAGVGALALLGRTSDTKQEAHEAAEQMVNDLAQFAEPPSTVQGIPQTPLDEPGHP